MGIGTPFFGMRGTVPHFLGRKVKNLLLLTEAICGYHYYFLRPLAQSRRLKIKQLRLDMALTQI